MEQIVDSNVLGRTLISNCRLGKLVAAPFQPTHDLRSHANGDPFRSARTATRTISAQTTLSRLQLAADSAFSQHLVVVVVVVVVVVGSPKKESLRDEGGMEGEGAESHPAE